MTPRVDAEDWSLRIHGDVDREVTLTYADLQEMPLFEQYVTIACVSNRVGDDLIGNALWTGVDLREVLDMAGVQPGGEQIVGRSVDGFTAGFPTSWAMDPDRRPMIAIGMNGQPLPVAHGYPARLIIPGLYGYVSATKWLSQIELTTWDGFDGYWIPRGWAKEAPILTQSRIDTPRSGATVAAAQQPREQLSVPRPRRVVCGAVRDVLHRQALAEPRGSHLVEARHRRVTRDRRAAWAPSARSQGR